MLSISNTVASAFRRKSGLRVLLAAAALLLGPATASAQIYAWRDASGHLVLSDQAKDPSAQTYAISVAPAAFRTTRPLSTRATLYNDLIEEHAARNVVSADLVRALIQAESAFNPRAVSSKGAMGLMQLMPATAAEHGVLDPFNPAENIRAGVKYLKQLLVSYEGRVELALAAYNAGPGAVKKVRRQGASLSRDPELRRANPEHRHGHQRRATQTGLPDGGDRGRPRSGPLLGEAARRRRAARIGRAALKIAPLIPFFQPAEPSPLALVGRGRRSRERPRQPRQPPHFDLLLGRPGSPILVELARLGLRDVPIGEPAHHDDLLPAHRPADHDLIAGPDLAVRLGGLAVHVDPADFAGFLSLRARAEEAGHIQPDVEPQGLHAIIGGLQSVPRCYRAEHSERGPELSG